MAVVAAVIHRKHAVIVSARASLDDRRHMLTSLDREIKPRSRQVGDTTLS